MVNRVLFTLNIFQKWMECKGMIWGKIHKGKTRPNAIGERFNQTCREDVWKHSYSLFKMMQRSSRVFGRKNTTTFVRMRNQTPNECAP